MKKIMFVGCSFTAGSGWSITDSCAENKHSPYLWTNLCRQQSPHLNYLEYSNDAVAGASNTEIFENAVSAMVTHGNSIQVMFCQWTSMPRYNFNPGFELWPTAEGLRRERRQHDVVLNRGQIWSRDYINEVCDRLLVMHHLHWEILKVVKYCNILMALAKTCGIQHVFFINGLCPWDENYFKYLETCTPESYTPFTKQQILNIDSRDDSDIYKLYQEAHQHYQKAGGILESHWINLYNSFLSAQTDVNFDHKHPGKDSNEIYSQKIINHIDQIL